jgi:hypothetical protein
MTPQLSISRTSSPPSRRYTGTPIWLWLAALLASGCGSKSSPVNSTGRQEHARAVAASTPATGRCVPARVLRRNPPAWARISGAPPTPPTPFVVGAGDHVAGFLFRFPLRARLPVSTADKILWAIGTDAKALRITARRPGRTDRTVRVPVSIDGGSGQIQRSRARFPQPGCWRLELRWGSRRATVDVDVRP